MTAVPIPLRSEQPAAEAFPSSQAKAVALSWTVTVGWWALCRLPFWRPLPDFFDSPEYRWRVEGGFWSGFHNGGSHLPYQRELYAPAGALYELGHGAWSAYGCIASCSIVYGFAAFLALAFLWRRFFPGRVALLSLALYPILTGPALADLSTYSMSAVHAFLFGGTALLAHALATSCHSRGRAWLSSLTASLLFGLAADTHLISILWASVPAVVVIAWLFQAPAMSCERCGEPPLQERLRTIGVHAVVLPGLAVALAILLSGWDLAHIGVAHSVKEGVARLLFRDSYIPKQWRFRQGHIVLVTGGIGAFYALWGAVRWAWRAGISGWLALGALAASFVACAVQWYAGFTGRLYLPMLAWFVPFMILGSGFDTLRPWRGWRRWGLLALLFLQTFATFAHVLWTRRTGPHWGEAEVAFTKQLERSGDAYVAAANTRTYDNVSAARNVIWGTPGADQALAAIRATGRSRIFMSSQALRYNALQRDGQLLSPVEPLVPRHPGSLEDYVRSWGALMLDQPTGRGEFISEVVSKEKAPPLGQRLERARSFLNEGGLLVAVTDPARPRWAFVQGPRLIDCVSRETYDAYELSAFLSIPSVHCQPVAVGLTDATGVLMRPLPERDSFTVKLHPWAYQGVPEQVAFNAADFQVMSRAEAESRLDAAKAPFVAILQPDDRGVKLSLHPL